MGSGVRDEDGHVFVELLMYIFGLSLLLCAVMEFGMFAVGSSAVDDAAYAACRALAQDTSLTTDELKNVALKASPSISGAITGLSRSVGGVQSNPYVHHLPNGAGDRSSDAATRKVSVEITCSYEPVTIAGRLVTGGADVTLKARSVEVADAMVGGGESPW